MTLPTGGVALTLIGRRGARLLLLCFYALYYRMIWNTSTAIN